jgi:hypothetical protein
VLEDLPEKNTFIDYPPVPMVESDAPPTTSAPALLNRFMKAAAAQRVQPETGKMASDQGFACNSDAEDLATDTSEEGSPEEEVHGRTMAKVSFSLSSDLEELPERNTFIDYPPVPMAESSEPPTVSAPAFLDRFKKTSTPPLAPPGNWHSAGCKSERPAAKTDHDVSLDSSCSTECTSDSPVTEDLAEEVFCLPSVGSAGHSDGQCSPCAWFWKTSGCRGGPNCTYCHLCPPGARKAIKKAKVAVLRQSVTSTKEPAYVECGSSVPFLTTEATNALDMLHETSVICSGPEDVATAAEPVKVSVKNTFIQFEVASPLENHPEPPSRTAPGDFFRKFFKTREETSEVPLCPPGILSPCMPSTPTFSKDCRFGSNLCMNSSLMPATASNMAPSTPSADEDVEEASQDAIAPMNGKEAHAVGQCTPCAYFWYKKDGCRKGDECEFCHRCQKGEIKRRKKNRVQHLKAVGAYIPGYSKIQEAMKQAHCQYLQ